MVCLFSQSGKKIQVNSSKEKGRGKKSCSTSVFFTTAGNVLRGGEKGGRRWKALFRCVFHHVVLTNYYFLCCVKNLYKKESTGNATARISLHLQKKRRCWKSTTVRTKALCVCVFFPFLMLSPLQDKCVTLCLSLFFSPASQ